jgi:hypothetical protein
VADVSWGKIGGLELVTCRIGKGRLLTLVRSAWAVCTEEDMRAGEWEDWIGLTNGGEL